MAPSAPHKNHRQEHDAQNHQLEESRRIRLGGGHGHDALFSGALSRDQYVPARHGSAVAVCIRGLKYSYTLFLFSTPYISYSVALSGLYIFALNARQRIRAGRLPLFPDPGKRDDLFLIVREVLHPLKQDPAENA